MALQFAGAILMKLQVHQLLCLKETARARGTPWSHQFVSLSGSPQTGSPPTNPAVPKGVCSRLPSLSGTVGLCRCATFRSTVTLDRQHVHNSFVTWAQLFMEMTTRTWQTITGVSIYLAKLLPVGARTFFRRSGSPQRVKLMAVLYRTLRPPYRLPRTFQKPRASRHFVENRRGCVSPCSSHQSILLVSPRACSDGVGLAWESAIETSPIRYVIVLNGA